MSEPWKPQQTECLIRKNLSHLLLLVHSEDDLLFVACLLINGIDKPSQVRIFLKLIIKTTCPFSDAPASLALMIVCD